LKEREVREPLKASNLRSIHIHVHELINEGKGTLKGKGGSKLLEIGEKQTSLKEEKRKWKT
ncbi:hypothetical protein Leryth_011205, partial [Lithospermum erythrorhizon]